MRKIVFLASWGMSWLLSWGTQAQLRFQPFTSLEASAGVSRLVSDLSPMASWQQGYRWSGGIGGFRHLNPRIAVGASLDWTRLGADDFYSPTPETFFRNVHVRNDLKSINLMGKYYLIPFESAIGRTSGTWHPYLTAGVGYFFHNPKARSPLPDRAWTELQPLATEGQGIVPGVEDPYKLRGFQLPLGFGVERLEGRWLFGISAQVVFTGTDYLDDMKGNYYNLGLNPSQQARIMAQRHSELEAARSRKDRVDGIRPFFEEIIGFTPNQPREDIISVMNSFPFGSDPTNPALSLRGRVAGNDYYATIRFKVVYTIRDGVRCP